MKKIVLAYSGGLDTSVILKWLLENKWDVIAYIADIGQDEDFESARRKAIDIGASDVYIEDLKEEFIIDYIYPALKASARYEGRYLLGTSLARPVIAKRQVEVARKVGASALSHGATGKGNDQVRFELAYMSLAPDLDIIAPWKDKEFLSQFEGREDLLQYASECNIPIEGGKKPFSMDANLMHVSYESGVLEDPSKSPPEDMFRLTTSPENAPEKGVEISIFFEKGVPVKLVNRENKKKFSRPLELFTYLNKLAGQHGIGRIDIVENRFVGIKSRGVYETPAGTVLWAAHEDLELLSIDREIYRLKQNLMPRYAEAAYSGFWFSPEMDFMQTIVDKSQEWVNGEVRVMLYKGNVIIKGRSSTNPLYNEELASMNVSGSYDQEDARGFIRINAVRLCAAMHRLQEETS